LQAGSELELQAVRPMARTLVSMAGWAIFGTMVVLTGVLMAIRPLIPFLYDLPFTSALAMSAQSPAVVMALLGETQADGIVSRTILAMVVVADLAVIIFYGIASAGA